MMPTINPRPYNYFQQIAADKLLTLIGVVGPTPAQVELALQIIEDIERYTASKAGT